MGWGGVQFDGSDDYLSGGNAQWLDSLTKFSLSVWVYHDDITQDAYIFARQDSDITGGGILFLRDDVDSVSSRTDVYTVFFQGPSGGGDNVRSVSATSSSPLQSWTHLCLTFTTGSGVGLDLLVNGTSAGGDFPDSTSTAPTNTGTTNDVLDIGANDEGEPVFSGRISDLTVWDVQLTDAECQLIYNSRLKGISRQVQSSNILAYWSLDDLSDGASCTSTTIRDTSGNGRDMTSNSGCTGAAEDNLSYP